MTSRLGRPAWGLALAAVSLACGGISPRSTSADELFVADRATNRILSFDPVTGEFNRVLVDQGLLIPSAITFGPGGFLYVANLGTGQVLKVDPVTGATSPYVVAYGPGGLLYDSNSNTMFVAEFGQFDGDEVYQYDASGAPLNVIGTGTPMTGRGGMALRGGDLFVTAFAEEGFFAGKVRKYDGQNNFASEGVVASDPQFGGANGLAFSANGDLYVAGLLSQGVVKFNVSAGPDTMATQFGFPIPYPAGLLVDVQNQTEVMYITSLGNDNPTDPIYGNFLFPGAIFKFDVATGLPIGEGAFIQSGGASDHDNDGDVDNRDFAVWSAAFGESGAADADNDDDSDGADFLQWQRDRGRLGDFQPTSVAIYRTQVIGATAVPEPASLLLAGLAAAAGGVLRRRRR